MNPVQRTCENVGCFTILPLAEYASPEGDVRILCARHGRLHEDGVALRFDGTGCTPLTGSVGE